MHGRRIMRLAAAAACGAGIALMAVTTASASPVPVGGQSVAVSHHTSTRISNESLRCDTSTVVFADECFAIQSESGYQMWTSGSVVEGRRDAYTKHEDWQIIPNGTDASLEYSPLGDPGASPLCVTSDGTAVYMASCNTPENAPQQAVCVTGTIVDSSVAFVNDPDGNGNPRVLTAHGNKAGLTLTNRQGTSGQSWSIDLSALGVQLPLALLVPSC